MLHVCVRQNVVPVYMDKTTDEIPNILLRGVFRYGKFPRHNVSYHVMAYCASRVTALRRKHRNVEEREVHCHLQAGSMQQSE